MLPLPMGACQLWPGLWPSVRGPAFGRKLGAVLPARAGTASVRAWSGLADSSGIPMQGEQYTTEMGTWQFVWLLLIELNWARDSCRVNPAGGQT